MTTSDDVIRLLDLKPHPEGGHYRELFRDQSVDGDRAASTAIYFLLKAGEISRWHCVDAVEVWHWYGGSPLELSVADGDDEFQSFVLGMDLAAGQRPQERVPAFHWQQARSLGEWTLVGCTVAPGFEFAGFELAPDGWLPPNDRRGGDGPGPDTTD
jgi:uncharacterized protein